MPQQCITPRNTCNDNFRISMRDQENAWFRCGIECCCSMMWRQEQVEFNVLLQIRMCVVFCNWLVRGMRTKYGMSRALNILSVQEYSLRIWKWRTQLIIVLCCIEYKRWKKWSLKGKIYIYIFPLFQKNIVSLGLFVYVLVNFEIQRNRNIEVESLHLSACTHTYFQSEFSTQISRKNDICTIGLFFRNDNYLKNSKINQKR